MTRVDIRFNAIAGDGASQLSVAVLGNSNIEVFNEIPIKEMRADSFTELHLNEKYIGVELEGGMVVAGLLPVMASLTRLDVSYNILDRGGNGVQLLRDAVRQREGFVLIDDGND